MNLLLARRVIRWGLPWLALGLVGCVWGGSGHPAGDEPFDSAHRTWNRLLASYLGPQGIRYEAIHKDPSLLEMTVRELQSVNAAQFETWSPDAQLAFLINAHNSFAAARIAAAWPVRSLAQTRRWLSARRARDIDLLERRWSLQSLAKRIMSDRYGQSRAIFLINWGEAGCAPLPPVAVTSFNLADLLERQTRLFMADPRSCRYETQDNVIHLSRLLKWYRPQFERDFGTLWIFLGEGLPPAQARRLRPLPPVIRYLDFDRSLNDTEKAGVANASDASLTQAGR